MDHDPHERPRASLTRLLTGSRLHVRWLVSAIARDRIPELSQTKHRHEALVDTPHLLSARQRDMVAKSAHVDRSDLLYQDPCRIAIDNHLRADDRRTCASRCRSDEDHGTG